MIAYHLCKQALSIIRPRINDKVYILCYESHDTEEPVRRNYTMGNRNAGMKALWHLQNIRAIDNPSWVRMGAMDGGIQGAPAIFQMWQLHIELATPSMGHFQHSQFTPHYFSQNETHSLEATVYSVTEWTRMYTWGTFLAEPVEWRNREGKDLRMKEIMFLNDIVGCEVRFWVVGSWEDKEMKWDGGSLDRGSFPSNTQLEPGNFPFHHLTNPHVSVVHPWLTKNTWISIILTWNLILWRFVNRPWSILWYWCQILFKFSWNDIFNKCVLPVPAPEYLKLTYQASE